MSYGVKPGINGAILKLELSFLKSDFINILNLMGYKAVEAYKRILFIDFMFPPAYAIFLASMVINIGQRININNITTAKIILLTIPFDYIENIFHLRFVNSPEKAYQIEYFISGVFSSLRWIIVIYAVFYIIYLLIRLKNYVKD